MNRSGTSLVESAALSSAQLAIWLDQSRSPDLPLYVISGVVTGQGHIDAVCLQLAVDEVVGAHDALRSRIVLADDGTPGLRILERDPRRVNMLLAPAADSTEQWIGDYLKQFATSPFDLAGPLWDCELLQSNEQQWRLLFRIHHLICDGIGLDLIQHEIEAAYNRLSESREHIAEKAPSFLEATADERSYLDSERYQRDRDFWLARLPALRLRLIEAERWRDGGQASALAGSNSAGLQAGQPATAALAGSISARSGQCLLEIPRAQFVGLSQWAESAGGTVSHVLIAVIATWFARVLDQSALAIGFVVHNRHGARQKRMVGMFSSVLPLCLDIDPEQNISGLIGAVAAELRRCFRHQRFPMVELNRRLQLQQHGRNQPYDISFSFEASSSYQFGESHARMTVLDHGHEPLPLAVSVRDYDPDQPVTIAFTHHLATLGAVQMRAIVPRLQQMLDVIASQPELRLRELPLLTAVEQTRVLRLSAGSPIQQSAFMFTHDRIAAIAASRPDALALVGDGFELSYGELNVRANRVAHQLLALGVRPDDRVGLCLRRGVEQLIGLLAIHKAGAAYLPLDPDYPTQRLAYMLADAAPVMLLSELVLRTALPATAIPILWLDDLTRFETFPEHDPVLPELRFSHLAYLIYTSGSTGAPKGVMVEHAQLAQQVDTHVAQCGLSSADRMLQFASISFDSAVVEIFPTLAVGASLVLRPAAAASPDSGFVDYLDRHRVTVCDLPTAFWAQWATQMSAGQSRPGCAQRLLVVGGEKVEKRHLQAWLEAPATCGCDWLNTYGPTEATVYATALRIAAGASCPVGEVPIGRPTGQSRIYLLDRSGHLLPPGVVGEICIGGAGIARGYLQRPELTAQRFFADPFSTDPQARLYRTGDLGRWRDDGQLEFHGRNDFQVKLRGFRIELGEIEAALTLHEDVREAIVEVRCTGEQARLVAYLVATDEQTTLDGRALRQFLAQRLAEHMLPAAYVQLSVLPLTVNGKIDRKALPEAAGSALPNRGYSAPQSALEQTLAELWQELLGVEKVGRDDNFFELGGHSLLLIRLLEMLRQRGLASDVRSVFEAPSLAALAAALDIAVPADAGLAPANRIPANASLIEPKMLSMLRLEQAEIDHLCGEVRGGAANVQDVYPLAPLQEGMLFHHRLEEAGDAYLMHSALAFSERAQLDAFVQALQQVIDRHDALRTSIHWHGLAEPVQVVQRRASLPAHELVLGPGEVLPQLLAATDPCHTRLDLRRAPLLAAYAAADPQHSRWLLVLLDHHIVCDHITLELIIDEVGLILQGRQSELPQPWPYRHFVAHTRSTSASAHESYFRAQLGDVVEPTAPFDVLDVHASDDRIEEAVATLDPALSARARELARRENLSPSTLFHLAWALLVARCSGRDEAVFGTVLAGRSQGSAGADRAMGLFLNTLPVRIRLGEVSLRQALHDTQRRLAELLGHEQAPLALAQRCSGVLAPQPLFTSLLNYRHSSIATSELNRDEGLTIRGWDGLRVLQVVERTHYPLSISIDDSGQAFAISVHAVSRIGASVMVTRFCEVIAELVSARPESALRALAVLSGAERRQLDAFGGSAQSHPWLGMRVHQLFEQQARLRPDAIAVVTDHQRVSYADLDRRADAIAVVLRRMQLRPDDLVALHMRRGVDLIVAILAIWKAGAAYLPLDPEYPQQRRSFMLDDSRPRVLIVERGEVASCRAQLGLDVTLPVLSLDEFEVADAVASTTEITSLDARTAPDDLAYLIYTSGSTGLPKGVMVSHRGLSNMLHAQVQTFALSPDSGVLQFASPSFDASVSELGMALCVGARLHLRERAALLPGSPLIEALLDPEITHVTLPSSALSACGDRAADAIPRSKLCLIVAGDVLPPEVARRWAGRQSLFNAYGPTEATVCATIHRCSADSLGSVPIGRPVPNTVLRLLDSQVRLVPIGVIGEIHIGGLGIARGYLQRPELTAERFVADPFSADPAARLYRTGDLGCWRADGQLEFHGRNDFQVKLRGFRVELGEIEAALRRLDGVRDAVVLARNDDGGDTRLVAYVVPSAVGYAIDSRVLREQLALQLAEHMLPVAYVKLPVLPLSANGKVDRKALPPPGDHALLRGAYAEPVGEVERGLADIWSELLRVDRVGRHDDFVDLGGHSLSTMQLATRVRERFDVELPLRQLFEKSAFRDQAALIVSAQLERFASSDLLELEKQLDELSADELRALLMEELSDES